MKDFREHFKQLARDKKVTRSHTLQFCIMKSMTAKTEQDRNVLAGILVENAFTEITNPAKLAANNFHIWKGVELAIKDTMAAPRGSELLGNLETEIEHNWFNSIVQDLNKKASDNNLPKEKMYTYIFVRTDLSKEQVVVQSSHVAMKLGHELGAIGIDDISEVNFVVCSAEDEEDLLKIEEFFDTYQVPTVLFQEPDMFSEATAFATYPISERFKNRHFRDFKLLSYGSERLVSDLV